MIDYPLPVLGVSAYSGTGKTTLLRSLLPILRGKGLRVGVIKHAHHLFEVDHPEKDSYELRKAGAVEMLVASRRRMALVTEFEDDHPEPTLREMLSSINHEKLDLVLVEGFKREDFPKIELHRPSLGKPLLSAGDSHYIAIATDQPLRETPRGLPQLNLNDADEIAGFIQAYMHKFRENRLHEPQQANSHQLC
jgi:molybdopterin-guanine dinucleotide biosynthesis protein B